MTTARQPQTQADGNGTVAGYEEELWRMAEALRGSVDAAKYTHVVVGLIFLKYICDAFEETYARLKSRAASALTPRDRTSTVARASSGCRRRRSSPTSSCKARQPVIEQPVVDAMTAIHSPGQKADYILANPPFNVSDWGGERQQQDKRWDYGVSPKEMPMLHVIDGYMQQFLDCSLSLPLTSIALTEQRNVLLPRLVSVRVRVGDAPHMSTGIA